MKDRTRQGASQGSAARTLTFILVGGFLLAGEAWDAEAQTQPRQTGDVVTSVGAGGTLYVVDTRFNEGTLVQGSLGYALGPSWMIETGVRRHGCFDCDRFWIVDAGVQWQHARERLRTFASVGGGRASDPGFMGVEWGAHASVGTGIALDDTWGLRLELRVRQLGAAMGGPDGMGELTVGVDRAIRRRGR